MSQVSLSDAWEKEALRWAAWAREPGHDSYWKFHRDQFFELVPEPGELTVDVGCGEGRLDRDLKRMGHKVIGVDASETLVRLAKEADPEGDYRLANAAELPLENDCADLIVSFMCLQDVDDVEAAIKEIARVLKRGRYACIAIVHPLNSAGKFCSEDEESEFVIGGDYLKEFRYSDTLERNGFEMTFHSQHRSLEIYSKAFEKSGLVIQAVREHPVPEHAVNNHSLKRWQRLPLFLHMRVLRV